MRNYADGVLRDSLSQAGTLKQGDTGEFLRFGDDTLGDHLNGTIDEVAIYEKALSPQRILALYTAGSARGFPQQLAGARILALAASDLWSEANIPAGSFLVQPTMKYGQSKLDEIKECVAAEQPHAQFFFDGADPVYLPWEYKATGAYMTSQATIGDSGAEVPYQSIELDYDNEVWNEVTASADGGGAQTVSDTTSIAARGRRAMPPVTGLINSDDANVLQVAGALLEEFKQPALRPTTVTLNGATAAARTQILTRSIGDMVRVRRRGEGGTPIDRMTHILGYSKTLGVNRHLVCTYNLARGFNAGLSQWRAGTTGFSEAGVTTVAA
jgi:hypothetical protein